MQRVYLDNAATTALHPEVIDEMVRTMKISFGNPSSSHIFGREAKALVELSRKKIASLLNVSASEIYFTSCGTESNNTIIRSCVQDLNISRIITSKLEHKCVQETIKDIENRKNIEVICINTLKDGSIDYAELEELLLNQEKRTLVSLMHANNEIGNLLDIKLVSKICKENNALFHTDTVQTIGHYPIDLLDLDIDFASCSAHKIHGPKGIGFMYIRKRNQLKPLILGGGQEKGMRSGTENVYGIVGLSKALEISIKELNQNRKHIEDLKYYTISRLKSEIEGVDFNGLSSDFEKSLYTILNIKMPFYDNLISFELELAGIAVSQGSACSSGAAKVSNVISSLYSFEEIEKVTPIRVSFSYLNTKNDVDILIDTLKKITKKK